MHAHGAHFGDSLMAHYHYFRIWDDIAIDLGLPLQAFPGLVLAPHQGWLFIWDGTFPG